MESQKDKLLLLQKAVQLESNIRHAISTITEKFVEHRLSLLKDYNRLGVLILTGAVTFLITKPELIKTPILLIIGILSLLLVIFVSFITQQALFNKEEALIINLERYGQKLNDKITASQMFPEHEEHFRELDDLLEESFKPLVKSTWLIRHGHFLTFLLFILGVLLLVISVLLKITFKSILIKNFENLKLWR